MLITAKDSEIWIHSMGKRFQLMAVADNADEANQYMERHDDAAVIADFGPLVFMANKYFGAKSETE